jgi:hypothetical protein
MKTLAKHSDQTAIAQRLERVRVDSPRRWGKMSSHQMVCHLSDAFRGVMGEKVLPVKHGMYGRRIMRWLALNSGVPWPHGVPTMPEMDQFIGGTRPAEFEADRQALRVLFERFIHEPRDFTWQEHPMFLVMSDAQWLRWGYLHMDHHFRQFGV